MEEPLKYDWLLDCHSHAIAEERLAGLEHFHLGGKAVLETAAERLGLPTGKNVIELGCGLGGVGRFLLRRKPELRIMGYDTNENLCAINQMLNRHLGLDQYQIRQRDLFEAEIPAGASVVLSHIALIVGVRPMCAFLQDKPVSELWLLEPIRLGEYTYPQIWAQSAEADLLESRETLEAHWAGMGFCCEAEADLSSVACHYQPPKHDASMPSLAEIVPVADFMEKAHNGRVALLQQTIGLMAWRYRRTV